jgi:hypothetical protein
LNNVVIAAVGDHGTAIAGGIEIVDSKVNGTITETTTLNNAVIAGVGRIVTARVGGVRIN